MRHHAGKEGETGIYTENDSQIAGPTKKLISLLIELGLNKYESKVYLALITEGTSTAKNISNITGIPYGKVYEIINAIANKGFCLILPTKPMRCQAVSPKKTLEKTRDALHDQFRNLESQIMQDLEPFFQKTKEFNDPKGMFWVINGRSNVLRKVGEIIGKAQEYVYIFTTENGLRRAVIHKEDLLNAHSRNVDIKIGGEITDLNLEDIKSLIFCDLRNISRTSSTFISVDGKESMIIEAIPDDDNTIYGHDFGLWVSNLAFTRLIEESFLTKFNRVKPYRYPEEVESRSIADKRQKVCQGNA